LICHTGYKLQCLSSGCQACQAFGELYSAGPLSWEWCGENSTQEFEQECCTCAAPELPPPTRRPIEVNASCQRDCYEDSGSCVDSPCDFTLSCPAGYALSSALPMCQRDCTIFGDNYVQSRFIAHFLECEYGWGETLGSYDYRSCRTCQVFEPVATTVTSTSTGGMRGLTILP